METDYPPGKYQSELQGLTELVKIALRARIRGDPPISFIEDIIRERQDKLYAAIPINEELRIYMDQCNEVAQTNMKKFLEELKTSKYRTSDELRRSWAATQALVTALNVVHENNAPIACIKDEVTPKQESSMELVASTINEHR